VILDPDNKINRCGDEFARHIRHDFADKLLKTVKSVCSAIGVNGCNAAGMTGRPSFQKIERFTAANLADDDAVRAKTKGRTHELAHGNGWLRAKGYAILCRALELTRVFQKEDAVIFIRDFREKRIGQRRFAGPCSAYDKNILPRLYSTAQSISAKLAQCAAAHIITKFKNARSRYANGK